MRFLFLIIVAAHMLSNAYVNPGLFGKTADTIFKEVLGDIDIQDELKRWTIPDDPNDLKVKLVESVTTTKKPLNTKKRSGKPRKLLSLKELKKRRRRRQIEDILNDRRSHIPNFDNEEDDTQIITRRFDKHRQIARIKELTWAELKRRYYWRNRTINIMEHFIYSTRYKLVFTQVLRKKYYRVLRYRIGYCFGLLGHLKRQQMILYSALTINRYVTSRLFMHMRFYEKIMRLDVDIKDVIRIVRKLDRQQKLLDDPNYFDTYVADEFSTTTRPRLGTGRVKSSLLDGDDSSNVLLTAGTYGTMAPHKLIPIEGKNASKLRRGILF